MRRGFSSASRRALTLTVLLAGCGPSPDFGYVSEVQIPQAQTQAPGVIINVENDHIQRYTIHLGWPAEVGRRGRVHVEIDETRTTMVRRAGVDTDAKNEHKRIVADGSAVTLEVDEHGSTTKADIALDVLDAEGWDGTAAVHLRNAKVHVERGHSDDEAVVTIDGRDARAKSERDAIDELITLKISDQPTDDETFGTSDPITLGTHWPVRTEATRRALLAEDMRVPPGGISGQMLLAGVTDRGGVPCLDITGTIHIEPFEVASLPPEAHMEHASVHVVTHVVVPTSPGPRFQDDMTMTTDLALATPDGSLIESHSQRASRRTFTPGE